MAFIASGLNHRTAPLAIRERMAIPQSAQDRLLLGLLKLPSVREAMILSTCNRTEIYCDADNPEQIWQWLCDMQRLNIDILEPHLYYLEGEAALRHGIRVAVGLDSMMLGEPQILGQLKQAFAAAEQLGAIQQGLRPVFQHIFAASKTIRSQSGIGHNPVSIASAAIQLLGQHWPDYKTKRALIIGSGETSSLLAKHLHSQGLRSFVVAGRNLQQAEFLAKQLGGQAVDIQTIQDHLNHCDIIASATACPLPFISKQMVAEAMAQRKTKPLFFLDLAVPRDIEAEIAELAHVLLFNIDDLELISQESRQSRQKAAAEAEVLLEASIEAYQNQHRIQKADQLICLYRQQMQDLASQELQRAQQKLGQGQDPTQVLNDFCARLQNKLSHAQTLGFKQAAADGRQDVLDMARYFFNQSLDESPYETIT